MRMPEVEVEVLLSKDSVSSAPPQTKDLKQNKALVQHTSSLDGVRPKSLIFQRHKGVANRSCTAKVSWEHHQSFSAERP